MARADLLLMLSQSSLKGDSSKVKKIIEAIISEERAKQHNVLADQLENMLNESIKARGNNNGTSVIQQKNGNLFHEIVPEQRIDDLVLPKAVREICGELVEEHHRGDLLRSYNLEPRNRILLTGPPGNGKTSLAEGIAEALLVPLYIVRYESIVGTYLGETSNRLRSLFDYSKTRNCVLFFDEFETLGKERGDTHETGEIKRVVSSFLLQIDSLPSYTVVIGATNHSELLDRAVWRRFQIRMELPSPTEARLIEWLEKFQRRSELDFGYASSTLAKKLKGYSFGEVEEFCLSVFRQFVLQQPDSNIRLIVNKTLKNWKIRSYNPTN